jgi:prepilin-type N-terminal cleavage/methylation domain-containing protein
MRTLHRKRVRRAFTLIEILIVVVILGILAAIVIPQFTDASQEASASNLASQLQTIRSQIELYNVQNVNTTFDPVANDWDQLTNNDYLQAPPKNPFADAGVQTVIAAGVAGDSTMQGWLWGDAAGFGTSVYATVPAGSDYEAGVGLFDFDMDGIAD